MDGDCTISVKDQRERIIVKKEGRNIQVNQSAWKKGSGSVRPFISEPAAWRETREG